MPSPPRFVSFLSDFGRGDESVGVCHAVMLDLAPDLRVIDVTHDVPPFDVRAGGLALVRAAQYLPAGIVLAAVDPGAGTDRRLLAVAVEQGYLIGPDNGILAPGVAMLGGPQEVVSLTSEEHQLPAPGPVFAARDVLAPAAGHLAAGVALSDLGDPVDPATLTPGLLPLPREEDGAWVGEVLWVDRFGNLQLNLDPDVLVERGLQPGAAIEVHVRDDTRRARWVRGYADAKASELVVLTDSYGMLSLALDRRSAAEELGARAGTPVRIVAPGAPGSLGPDEVPVRLDVNRGTPPDRGGAS